MATLIPLDNTNATLTDGMRLDGTDLKFFENYHIGNIDGTVGTADDELNSVGYSAIYNGKIYVITHNYLKRFALDKTFEAKLNFDGHSAGALGRGYININTGLAIGCRCISNTSGIITIFDLDTFTIKHQFGDQTNGWQYLITGLIDDENKIYFTRNATTYPGENTSLPKALMQYQYDSVAGTITLLQEYIDSGTSYIFNSIYGLTIYDHDDTYVYAEPNRFGIVRFRKDDFTQYDVFRISISSSYNISTQGSQCSSISFFIKDGKYYSFNPTYGRWVEINPDGWVYEEETLKLWNEIQPELNSWHPVWRIGNNGILMSTKNPDYWCVGGSVSVGKVCIWNPKLTQQAISEPYTATNPGKLNGFDIKGEELTLCTYEYRLNSGTWIAYDNTAYADIDITIATNDTIELRAYGGDFEEPEKGGFYISSVNIIFTAHITALLPVTDLVATTTSATVTLNWSTTNVSGYVVQHSLAPMGTFTDLATVTSSTYVIAYSNPDDQQIPHYYRITGVTSGNYAPAGNVVTAVPNKAGSENIYKYIVNQLISTLKNDSRLNIVEEWFEKPPDKTMSFRRVSGWVYYTGEIFNDWVALGEKELHEGVQIGFKIKEPTAFEKANSNDYTEPKDLLFQAKEVLYSYISLVDYCFDMEIRDEGIIPNNDGATSMVLISTVWKKRIRR